VNRPCPVCRGKGTVPSQRCPTCQGAGEVRVEKRINVDIPPASRRVRVLRLKNQGPKGVAISWCRFTSPRIASSGAKASISSVSCRST